MLYLVFLLLPLLLYAVFARIIIFHLKRYSINEGATRNMTTFFVGISIVLILFTSLAFFAIPWDNLNFADIQNYFNFSPDFNQSQNIKINF